MWPENLKNIYFYIYSYNNQSWHSWWLTNILLLSSLYRSLDFEAQRPCTHLLDMLNTTIYTNLTYYITNTFQIYCMLIMLFYILYHWVIFWITPMLYHDMLHCISLVMHTTNAEGDWSPYHSCSESWLLCPYGTDVVKLQQVPTGTGPGLLVAPLLQFQKTVMASPGGATTASLGGTAAASQAVVQFPAIAFCQNLRNWNESLWVNSNKTALNILFEVHCPSSRSKPQNPVLPPSSAVIYVFNT